MTQEERWQQHYSRLLDFMNANKRRPSKYRPEERPLLNWYKYVKKQKKKGNLSTEQTEKFTMLTEVAERLRRVNQYDGEL